jgi:Mut7-C ubiquitin
MWITVRLYAALGRYRPPDVAPSGAFCWETTDGATPAQVAAELGIPHTLLRVCAVDGQTVAKEYALSPDDHLALLPASAGGAGRLRGDTERPQISSTDATTRVP